MGDELARCPYIPPLVTSMVSVGEETGQLSEMLTNVTRFYDREIEHTVRSLPKLIEPVVRHPTVPLFEIIGIGPKSGLHLLKIIVSVKLPEVASVEVIDQRWHIAAWKNGATRRRHRPAGYLSLSHSPAARRGRNLTAA